jgi:hypothetical protein
MPDLAPLAFDARARALSADAEGTGFRFALPVVPEGVARSPPPDKLAGAEVGPPGSDVASILMTELDERLEVDELRSLEDVRSGLDPPVAPDVPAASPTCSDLFVILTESEAASTCWKRS